MGKIDTAVYEHVYARIWDRLQRGVTTRNLINTGKRQSDSGQRAERDARADHRRVYGT